MRRRSRLASSVPWCLLVPLLGLIACYEAPLARVYVEDFEVLCEGTPCGWARTGGTPEQVQWVSTLHPGEHALRLEGDVSVRGPAASPEDLPAYSSNLTASMAMRCDDGGTIEVSVLMDDGAGIVVGTGSVSAGDEWRVSVVSLTSDFDSLSGMVTGVVIEKSGPGTCEIGDIVIDDLGFPNEC